MAKSNTTKQYHDRFPGVLSFLHKWISFIRIDVKHLQSINYSKQISFNNFPCCLSLKQTFGISVWKPKQILLYSVSLLTKHLFPTSSKTSWFSRSFSNSDGTWIFSARLPLIVPLRSFIFANWLSCTAEHQYNLEAGRCRRQLLLFWEWATRDNMHKTAEWHAEAFQMEVGSICLKIYLSWACVGNLNPSNSFKAA